MCRFLLFAVSLILLIPHAAWAQLNPMGQAGVTRAVVIGVSEFQNERIPRLHYAHADARAFADFLRSTAGGALPESQIKLLLNKDATQGQMAAALTWLMEESAAGDQAIIFFSGHGDMETQTFVKHGFLLTYDAPASTYMAGGAFPIIYLQSILQTLSIHKKAQVVLITDACHAGKLAGSNTENGMQGTQASVQQLAEQYDNEVRLLSCQPNEFSREGRQWGGGHGVFTYFLLDGLQGLADVNEDKTVTLLELQRYLEDEVPSAVAPESQIPVVFGNKGVKMAQVHDATLDALVAQRATQPTDEEGLKGFAKRSPQPTADPDSLVWAMYSQFQVALGEQHLLFPAENSAHSLYQRLRQAPAVAAHHQAMRLSLAAALQDEAQRAINDYLATNPVELRRRWSFDERYAHYPDYLNTAAELLGKDHFMHKELTTRALYFSGINLRMQGERERQRALYTQAVGIQNQVLALDSMAAYAHNELGLLARRRGQFDESIVHFQRALQYSPTWVLALTNLCGSYVDTEDYLLAESACQQALRYDNTFALTHHNQGAAYKAQQLWQPALEAYQQALRFAPDYPTTYSSMAEVYYEIGEKAAAKAAWQQSLALQPQQEEVLYNLGIVSKELGQPDTARYYFQSVVALTPDDREAHLEIAYLQMDAREFEAAAATLTTVHQLGHAPDGRYAQARWHALQRQTQLALDALEQAFSQGFADKALLQSDPAWDALRQNSRFQALLGN